MQWMCVECWVHTTEHTVHGGGGAVACSGCVQSAGCILQSTQCMVVVEQ